MAKRDFDEIPNYENMVSKGATLAEHLEWQLRMEYLTEDEWRVAHMIIHNVNDDGYLDINFEEIISETGHDREDAIAILGMVQVLDPVGCASSSLSECLLIQAKVLEERMPLVELIINQQLDALQKRDYSGIAKELGVSKDKVKDAEMVILGLNPKPGRLISPESIEYVVPDIYIHEVGGEFVIKLNDEGVPRLKISNLYKSMMGGSAAENNKEKDDAKEYLQDKLRAAMWLIKSIQNRGLKGPASFDLSINAPFIIGLLLTRPGDC
jgi:RNA polymerase sigma-54 factor